MVRFFKFFKKRRSKDNEERIVDTTINSRLRNDGLTTVVESVQRSTDFEEQSDFKEGEQESTLSVEGDSKQPDQTPISLSEQANISHIVNQASADSCNTGQNQNTTNLSEVFSDENVVASKDIGIQDTNTTVVPSNEVDSHEQVAKLESSKQSTVQNAAIVSKKEEMAPIKTVESSKVQGDGKIEPPRIAEASVDDVVAKHSKPKFIQQTMTSYDQIPVLDQTKLPRGGVSVDTKAVGRVQFGIPPETIKDSMRSGIPVPQVYIVPVERFCREMGPALGVNLAEFEFPAYFNFFVYKKRCTLVVDSEDAEDKIRRVFSETLLGPQQFLRPDDPITHEPEDFDPDFPSDMIPDFQKEFKHFRIMPDGKELQIETLLDFCHFESRAEGHSDLGVPPSGDENDSDDSIGEIDTLGEGESDVAEKEIALPRDATDLEQREKKKRWSYSQTRFMGDVAVIWPPNATDEEKKNRSVPRVEVFKMPDGTEYIVHDVDVNNQIIGKARLSGHVKVSENLSVDGFGGLNLMDELKPKIRASTTSPSVNDNAPSLEQTAMVAIPPTVPLPSFHPPSFGVTVLGNSHGFDASGSVSGYVLWINGRGVMIDPPPYSSATLEREGIRPRTIVGIIITHCHADHDAGTFQKILTGSPVVLITTPTIYKSFIRKYAALSALSPALLRHSHRYKPAVIGQPLRFQGAVFKFTYSLHTIPCVGFRVEWRGKSIVFTADHFNSPPAIDKLEESGILSKGRADDIRNIPMQHCDLLLHEAGAPPIHTPLEVLMKLPPDIKNRLYVVHTAKLPEGCDLKAAPTGTAGTLRLDSQMDNNLSTSFFTKTSASTSVGMPRNQAVQHDYYAMSDDQVDIENEIISIENSKESVKGNSLTTLRPSSSTDAWYILNLLSAIPFISSLSYQATMELLETARVDVYGVDEVVIPAAKRPLSLCMIWEGACAEKPRQTSSENVSNELTTEIETAVWYAGDWTGPLALQPERNLSSESKTGSTHDIVAVSKKGVQVISIDYSSLLAILKHGSQLFRNYLLRVGHWTDLNASTKEVSQELNVLELLNCNSALRKLSAVQKRHVESLAEGPVTLLPFEKMWQSGAVVDKAFIIVSGTAFFQVRRTASATDTASEFGDSVKADAMNVMKHLDRAANGHQSSGEDHSDLSSIETDDNRHFSLDLFGSAGGKDIDFVVKGLQARANHLADEEFTSTNAGHCDDVNNENEQESQLATIFIEGDPGTVSNRRSVLTRRGSRARIANNVLGRLYNRRAFTSGLVFSRGHFLGDVSKMVDRLSSADETVADDSETDGDAGPSYRLSETDHNGESMKFLSISALTIPEGSSSHSTVHTSTLTAGKDGCVALVFPKSTLTPLLDEYPGLLLSLLGTQVVV